MIKKIKELILFKFMSDAFFTKYCFYKHHGYMLNLKRVSTLNEKIQWLKLNNRKELDTIVADKLAVREYVSSLVGDKYLIPLLKIISDVEELKFRDTYPNGNFVIKANHNSGGTCIVKGEGFDEIHLYDASKAWLSENYYRKSKEWQYKNIKPSIFIEQLLIDDSGKIPMDYKLHCFNGRVEYIVVDIDRETNHKRNIYNRKWDIQPFTWSARDTHGDTLWGNGRDIEKPFELDEMIYVAERLAAEYPYLRVDLYVCESQVYFGELTLHHGSGFENILPFEWDIKLGELLKL